jgi:hypothetical protein
MSDNTKKTLIAIGALLLGAASIFPIVAGRRRKGGPHLGLLATALVGVVAAARRQPEGEFLGIPYSFRLPTPGRIKARLWNPADRRILTPHIFGWGWSLNFHALLKRIGLVAS